MTCARCTKPDAPRVKLHDGTECCTYCEAWRHETEARAILAMQPLQKRRWFLYGKPDSAGVPKNGVRQVRGEAEVKRLERTMTALWAARRKTA